MFFTTVFLALIAVVFMATATPFPQLGAQTAPWANGTGLPTAADFSRAALGLYYTDENDDRDLKIDAGTCEGIADISLMKWRAHCKHNIHLVTDFDCWSRAPTHESCCPIPKRRSCGLFRPAMGE